MLKATWQVVDSMGQMLLEEVHSFELEEVKSAKLRFEERLAMLEFREKKPLRSTLLFDGYVMEILPAELKPKKLFFH